MTDIDRRKFLMGTAAVAAVAAVPSGSLCQIEPLDEEAEVVFRMLTDWRMATPEEILADIQRTLTVMMQAEGAPFARRFSAFVLEDA
jgi:hypothetical protein